MVLILLWLLTCNLIPSTFTRQVSAGAMRDFEEFMFSCAVSCLYTSLLFSCAVSCHVYSTSLLGSLSYIESS